MRLITKNKKACPYRYAKRCRRGFSFIEVMVALFLLVVGMIVIVPIITQSLRQSLDSRDQVIAAELAQEGIELIRNLRDNNWAQGARSFCSDASCVYKFPATATNQTCRIDASGARDCSGVYPLYINGNGMYVHSSGTTTKFSRRISIVYKNSSGSLVNENDFTLATATVTSIVTWNGSTPPAPDNASGNFLSGTPCNTITKCAYTQVTFTKWGG